MGHYQQIRGTTEQTFGFNIGPENTIHHLLSQKHTHSLPRSLALSLCKAALLLGLVHHKYFGPALTNVCVSQGNGY